ncbi:unnamed protein product [Chrysodeixis includens]|uniref:Salivary secreted peptide n=1 Tax=Chrysodeixis includens TaxID=689277 RepID=A0A9N8L5D4_CHRIL|nr:unnamed protein product [Chrysodeixis includens]
MVYLNTFYISLNKYVQFQMKTIIFLAALAVLSLANGAAVEEKASPRYNLILGSTTSKDKLLHRNYYSKGAIANAVQSQDIIFRAGNSRVKINAIRAMEVGYTQYANAFLVSGGLGRNNATIRLQSARGYGYYYQVEIWGN